MGVNKMSLIILVAILIRIVLSLTTYHPDIQNFQLVDQMVSRGNILNLYDYPFTLDPENILAKTDLIYPPAIYLFRGAFSTIFSLIPGFGFNYNYNVVTPETFGDPLFNLHLLLIKIPMLLFDLLTFYWISRLFTQKRDKYLVSIIWLFNPVNLYTTYMMGQFDVIPVFFTVLALYFSAKNKSSSAALSLGFGAAFKIYPIFLLVPLMSNAKTTVERFKIILLGLLPYAVSVLVYLPSEGFRRTALVAGQTLKSLYAQIPVSGGESLLLFLLFLGFFYLIFYYVAKADYKLWTSSFLTLILFYIFTHFHPQWFLWITPFFIIELVEGRFRYQAACLLVLVCFTAQIFFFDPSLSVNIFSPLFPALATLPSLWQLLGLNLNYDFIRSLIQTVLVSLLLFYIYIYFPKKSDV